MEIPALWQTVGQVVIGLGALAAAVGVLAKSPYFGRPMRWIGRTLIVHPLNRWFMGLMHAANQPLEEKVDKIDKELHPNGGSSFRDEIRASRDEVRRVATEFQEFAKDSHADRVGIRKRLEASDKMSARELQEIRDRIEELKRDPYDSLNDIAGRIGRIQNGLPETKETES